MKGYKAFEKGMVCRGKQYAENTVFEEEKAEICKSGMHFCTNPLDCLDYYPLVDDNGNVVELAEVEALDEAVTDDDKKYCTKKLKIGGKVKIGNLVEVAGEYLRETVSAETKGAGVGGDSAQQVGGYGAKQVGGNGAKQVGGNEAKQVGGNGAKQVGGNDSILVNGAESKFKAGLRSIVVCYKYKNGELQKPVVGYVDGKELKPDTWYTLKDGKFVEVGE